jgi:uncharacterized membrane protein
MALPLGVVAGLRTFTAPAAAAWAVHLGRLDLRGSGLEFLGDAWVRWSLTGMALFELVADQLPSTGSRTKPAPFVGRLSSGALTGAAIGAVSGEGLAGALAGVAGAVVGTLGGHRARARLAAAFDNDHPAAVIEDALAIGGAVLSVSAAR